MNFCGTCGILLLKSNPEDTFCKPCKFANSIQINVFSRCNCEYCFSDSHTGVAAPTQYLEAEQQVQGISYCSKPVSPKPKKKRLRKGKSKTSLAPTNQKDCVPDTLDNFVDWSVDTQITHNKKPGEISPTDPTSLPSLFDWSTVSNNPVTYAGGWDSNKIEFVPENRAVPLPSMNSDSDPEDDSVSKEVEKSSHKNYYLHEEVRLKWEREQAEFHKQLVVQDTSVIKALVGGKRKKEDGSRYLIGGVDISFIKGNNEDACACLTVLQMPDLKMVYQRLEMVKLTQPYIPGFLAFREVPALEPLFDRLKSVAPHYWPDITMVDGNGMLHPRGFGLACQLGVMLDIPTLGVAKTLISAQGINLDEEHKNRRCTLTGAGDGFDLVSDSGQVLGKCVQVHDNAPNPVYVSVGHKVTLASAVWLALECSKFRIPEPVRRADLDSREYLRQSVTEPQEYILEE